MFSGFAAQSRVPRVPVDPGNISVTFLDTDGVVQNLEGVRAIERDGWVWLHPALGSRWPGRVAAVGSVTITASVGRAEERRVGKGGVSKIGTRWASDH